MLERKAEPPADAFLKGIRVENNPVFALLLGMCPALAVSNTVRNALSMGLAATFVLVLSCLIVSVLRKYIPKQVRIATFIVVIATFVTTVDYLIQAISLDVYKALGAFIPLIVVNCIILGRAEAYASRNDPYRAVLDAIGMGIGFTIALLAMGVVREALGFGTLLRDTPFEFHLFTKQFQPWAVMILPPGGFLTLGFWLLFINWREERKKRHADQKEPA